MRYIVALAVLLSGCVVYTDDVPRNGSVARQQCRVDCDQIYRECFWDGVPADICEEDYYWCQDRCDRIGLQPRRW